MLTYPSERYNPSGDYRPLIAHSCSSALLAYGDKAHGKTAAEVLLSSAIEAYWCLD